MVIAIVIARLHLQTDYFQPRSHWSAAGHLHVALT